MERQDHLQALRADPTAPGTKALTKAIGAESAAAKETKPRSSTADARGSATPSVANCGSTETSWPASVVRVAEFAYAQQLVPRRQFAEAVAAKTLPVERKHLPLRTESLPTEGDSPAVADWLDFASFEPSLVVRFYC